MRIKYVKAARMWATIQQTKNHKQITSQDIKWFSTESDARLYRESVQGHETTKETQE
jgi:hypothetical protein